MDVDHEFERLCRVAGERQAQHEYDPGNRAKRQLAANADVELWQYARDWGHKTSAVIECFRKALADETQRLLREMTKNQQ